MRKCIIKMMFIISIAPGITHNASLWHHDGIYIVNNTQGDLLVEWDGGNRRIPKACAPCLNKMLIPVPVGTKISIAYLDRAPDRTMPSCQGGKQIEFTTRKNIVLYEITGGYTEDIGEFNKVGRGIRCIIEVARKKNVRAALKKYPDLK